MSLRNTDAVNFALRPNKNVERKLIVDSLHPLEESFAISKFRYIGFGSVWFADFLLIHRILGIRDMVSIEKECPDRAAFNAPYGCIRVEPGESTEVLPLLDLEQSRSLVWLDYDAGFDAGVLDDVPHCCDRLPSGSILMVTVNAHKGSVPTHGTDGEEISPSDSYKHWAGGFAPNDLPARLFTNKNYPNLVTATLHRCFKHSVVESGRELEFIPMFSYFYQDNAPMVTYGGMIANTADKVLLEKRMGPREEDEMPSRPIRVPPLTYKEKMHMDVLLPCEGLTADIVQTVLGFRLKDEQVASYCEYYKFYPVFGEASVL
jgi:hypothetical protein